MLKQKATPQEIILWSRLKNRQFHHLKFRRQHIVGNYIVDFICIEKKLIIEIDGWQHSKEDLIQHNYDKERTNFFESLGYIVLRFWNGEVNTNLVGVMLKIEKVIFGEIN